MEKNWIIRFVCLAIALLCLGMFRSVKFGSHTYELDETYSSEGVQTIRLKTKNAKVTIAGVDRDDIQLTVYHFVDGEEDSIENYKFEFDVTRETGLLSIREKESMGWNRFIPRKREYTVSIEVPQTCSLELRGDDDEYAISNLAGTIFLRFDDGKVDLESCSGKLDLFCDDAKVRSVSGSLEAISLRSDVGLLYFENSLRENGDYRLTTGDGKLEWIVSQGVGAIEVLGSGARISYDDSFQYVGTKGVRSGFFFGSRGAEVRIRAEDSRVVFRSLGSKTKKKTIQHP